MHFVLIIAADTIVLEVFPRDLVEYILLTVVTSKVISAFK